MGCIFYWENMKKIFLLFCISSIFVSCYEQPNPNSTLPEISINEALETGGTVNLSKYASAIEYIPLETADKSAVMGQFVQADDTGYYVYSIMFANDVAKFDKRGKYVGRIGKKGRGPGEYSMLNSVGFIRSVKDVSDTGYIFISGYNKVVVYDNAGKFINELSFDSNIEDIAFVNNNGYALLFADGNGNERWQNLLMTDMDGNKQYEIRVGKTHREQINIKGGKAILRKNNSIYSFGDSLRIVNSTSDTIFSLKNMKKVPYLKLAINEKQGDNSSIECSPNSIFETSRFIKIPVSFPTPEYSKYFKNKRVPEKSSSANIIFDKQDKSITALLHDSQYELMYGFKNDLDDGAPFNPSYTDNKKMYQIVQAADFIEMASVSNSAKMKEIAATLTQESNPVIIEVILK